MASFGNQYTNGLSAIDTGTEADAFNSINGNLKFDAQASAVAITVGASVDVAYQDGLAVFTRTKGGLMYEASIGGQHFEFEAMK